MNRRKFTEVLEQAIVRHDEQHVPFCIVCVDLDGFKQVNDSWGHVVGDDVLVHVSSIMREGVGDRGAVGRWGGDELIILYQDCDGNRVLSLSDDIREQVDLNPYREDIHCTVSMGVAEHRVGETSVELIRRADKALYEAKTAGKNCVR
jgi:diguanylate cyclase (GGDEF)-like protein